MSQVSSKHFIRAKFCVFYFLGQQQLLMRNSPLLCPAANPFQGAHSQFETDKRTQREEERERDSGNGEKIN